MVRGGVDRDERIFLRRIRRVGTTPRRSTYSRGSVTAICRRAKRITFRFFPPCFLTSRYRFSTGTAPVSNGARDRCASWRPADRPVPPAHWRTPPAHQVNRGTSVHWRSLRGRPFSTLVARLTKILSPSSEVLDTIRDPCVRFRSTYYLRNRMPTVHNPLIVRIPFRLL